MIKTSIIGFFFVFLTTGTSHLAANVPYEELELWNSEMKKAVEPGEFEVMIGSSSEDIRLQESFTVK